MRVCICIHTYIHTLTVRAELQRADSAVEEALSEREQRLRAVHNIRAPDMHCGLLAHTTHILIQANIHVYT